MLATDAQVRKLMEEMSKNGKVGQAAMKAGLNRKTASKYVREGKLPSEMPVERTWRTRADPFEADWPEVARRLKDAPELKAKTLFEWLQGQRPEGYEAGQLRTFQRRVRDWRALHGPDKEGSLLRPGAPAGRGDAD